MSWRGPNRLTAFAFSHSGEHKDRICLWQASTPTFLSYVLTGVLYAPLLLLPLLPLHSDTKTLAHIAEHCKEMQIVTFLLGRRDVYFAASLFKFCSKLDSCCTLDSADPSSFLAGESVQLHYLDADIHFPEIFSSVKSSPVGMIRGGGRGEERNDTFRKKHLNQAWEFNLCGTPLSWSLSWARSPAARLVKRLSFTYKSKSKALGPERLCSLQSGVTGFSGRGCMVRNVAVRKSQEESL